MINKILFDKYNRDFHINDTYSILTEIFNHMAIESANLYYDQQLINKPYTEQNDPLKEYTARLKHVEFMINKSVEEEKYEFAAELKALYEDLKKVVDKLNKK